MVIPKVAYDFLFDDERLSDYNMMLCSFDSGGVETVSMGNNITFNTVKPALSDTNFFIGTSYDEMLTATFQICKNVCNKKNYSRGLPITSEEISSITRWLGRRESFHKLKIFQEGYENIYFLGNFNNFQTIKVGGEVVGLETTFVSNAPYGYLDSIIFDFTTTASSPYVINNLSHETGILYPSVFTCKCLQNGDLKIMNSLDSKYVEVKNCIKDEVITLDGKHKIISSNVVAHGKLYNDFNYNFFRLINTYHESDNSITTSIPCEIHTEYNPIRKVGIG